ncbi:MAG: STAS domain-containing protein [Rhodospirillales bacterium]|nr:STAS domain-containing protein [Rhodospirillales bacterium]
MDYASKQEGTTLAFSLTGKLSFADSETMKKAIEEAREASCTGCSIDLAGLTSIDSSGLGMLLMFNDALKEQEKNLALHGAVGQVHKMLEIAKLSQIITINP